MTRQEWAERSLEIVRSGRCRCTEDEACRDHAALESRVEQG